MEHIRGEVNIEIAWECPACKREGAPVYKELSFFQRDPCCQQEYCYCDSSPEVSQEVRCGECGTRYVLYTA